MAGGNYQGKGIDHPEIRALFERETMLASDWYRERLGVKQTRDIALWQRHAAALAAFRTSPANQGFASELAKRLALVDCQLARVSSPSYLEELRGTIGADAFRGQ